MPFKVISSAVQTAVDQRQKYKENGVRGCKPDYSETVELMMTGESLAQAGQHAPRRPIANS